ncbi:MAG: protein-L-isoaspartate(D-aspartate) O-methyltransferase [Planctomycetota bacterium]
MERRAVKSLVWGAVFWSGFLVLGGCKRGSDEGASKAGKPPAEEGAARPGADEARFARERERMVEELVASASDAPIVDPKVIRALRTVPRHEFVPEEFRDQSYLNTPLPIPESQTISQPYIVALMTQLLALRGDEKVLEVGTGSGYQAAILGELAGEVYTVEIRPALAETARKKLLELRERGVLQFQKLEVVVGDGSRGHPPAAPYDAIIVTAAPERVPVELLNQLKPGGRLVVPVGGDYIQELQLIEKREDGSYAEKPIVPVRFVPLVEGGPPR